MTSPSSMLCGLGIRIRSIIPLNFPLLHAAIISNEALGLNVPATLGSSLPHPLNQTNIERAAEL
jgi:hypothetical protein